MRVLITGGTGFIARNLFEQLKDKYNVICLGRKKLNLLNFGRVLAYIKSNRFDVVIHTATYDVAPKHSVKDPSKVLEYNLKMFFNLTRCKDYFGKMIYFGSGAEYCRENWKPRMRESYYDKYVPMDQYGFSKYLMTKHTQLSDNIYNLRLFGMFGKYDDWRTRLIPNVCYRAVMNLPIVIDQNKFYDFLDVNDLVKIVSWFIDNNPQEKVYNVCTGKAIAYKSLVEKIIKISGKNLSFRIKNKALGREYSGDNDLLMKELKGFEFIPIDESIKSLYDWYNQNKMKIFI
ncbi:NAD(P)-dependent oxidoreductase [Patescibacteria group bacterium]|nr:NAD(P)-dependent oxidoreductase [Patescibacteria group bacterium]MCG2702546.1 NAD(P)-dependent oxidoreductase [Candidatus Parcubacteria bacterium]MBU4265104.1 NAD(P)-dependent oxidoreductase [Patescibacteria group bacterium]MBU4390668.1 NAD(P)-dependent oxidoreductase [Patescibacteria group bacterium]MBU4396621.1 NAD(P)-dependent oxidoreductase [Patescibacteria group bacterium]